MARSHRSRNSTSHPLPDATGTTGQIGRLILSTTFILSFITIASTKTFTPPIAGATGSWTGASATGSGATPWTTFGGPVDLLNGNLMLSAGGLHLPGINGFDQTISPVYNSVNAANATWDAAGRWGPDAMSAS